MTKKINAKLMLELLGKAMTMCELTMGKSI